MNTTQQAAEVAKQIHALKIVECGPGTRIYSNPTEADTIAILAPVFAEKDKRIRELEAWKASAMQVESSWDCQRVARMLGIQLGADICVNIEPKVRALIAANTALAAEVAELKRWKESRFEWERSLQEVYDKAAAEVERLKALVECFRVQEEGNISIKAQLRAANEAAQDDAHAILGSADPRFSAPPTAQTEEGKTP